MGVNMKKRSLFLLTFISLLFIGMFNPPKVAAVGFESTYSFDITVVHGEGNLDMYKPALGMFNHGTKVSIDITSLNGLESVDSKEFAFFVVNGEIIENNLEEFMVTSNNKITAIFTNGVEHAAVFVDSNGEFLSIDYVDGVTAPVAPSVANLSKPGYTPVVFGTLAQISEHMVYVVGYELTNPDAVVMINEVSYPYNSVVTLTAEDSFTHWEENGVVVSYNSTYKFSALSDRTISQKSDGQTPSTIVTLSDDLGFRSSEGKSTYLGQFELANGEEFIEAGILASEIFVNNLTIDTPSVQVISSNAIQPMTNEFLRTVNTDDFAIVRGYLKTSIGIYYSENFTPKVNTGLMIYEVYGAGGNNGAVYKNDYVVLYNGTSSDIDLSGYTLQYASATGSFSALNQNILSGTILSGKYFVAKLSGGANGVDLPRVDFEGTLSLAAAAGKIALVLGTAPISGVNGTNVVDFVGFGTANYSEGNGATKAISTILSAKRKNFIDSNDNSTDFEVVTPDFTYVLDGEFYTASFNTDSGSVISDVEVYENNKLTQPSDPTKTGYVFENWYTTPDFTSVFDFNTLINADINIYAKWLIERTVTFVDGETTLSTSNVADGFKVSQPSNPTKSGHAFVNWYEDAAFTTVFDFNSEITDNTTIYAKWTIFVVTEETFEFRLTPEKNVTPSSTTYVDVYYLESHGHWDGKTNKASSTTFGTNGDTNNALEFIANEGYYVYSVQVQMGSGSGTARTLTAINQNKTSESQIVVGDVTTSSSPKTSEAVVLNFISNSVKFQSSGALTYYWIEVVVKSNPQ